jgi:hypothetical protein
VILDVLAETVATTEDVTRSVAASTGVVDAASIEIEIASTTRYFFIAGLDLGLSPRAWASTHRLLSVGRTSLLTEDRG